MVKKVNKYLCISNLHTKNKLQNAKKKNSKFQSRTKKKFLTVKVPRSHLFHLLLSGFNSQKLCCLYVYEYCGEARRLSRDENRRTKNILNTKRKGTLLLKRTLTLILVNVRGFLI